MDAIIVYAPYKFMNKFFLQVNKENLLVVSFDKLQSREVLYLPDRTQLLEIKYDEASRPITWAPSKGSFAPTVQRYDRYKIFLTESNFQKTVKYCNSAAITTYN